MKKIVVFKKPQTQKKPTIKKIKNKKRGKKDKVLFVFQYQEYGIWPELSSSAQS